MQNIVIATPILSDKAVLSSSASPGSLPVSNLQTRSVKKVWRSLDATATFVVIDMLAPKAINLVALIAHNGSSRSFGRVRAAASAAALTVTPGYDSGLKPLRSHQSGYDATWAATVSDEQYGSLSKNMFLLWLGATPQTYRYWRIDITDPASPNGYFDAGRLYLDYAWQPSTNKDYGTGQGMIDQSRDPRTVTSEPTPTPRPIKRYEEFTLSYMSEDEMYDHAFEIERLRGTTGDVLYLNDPTATKHLQRRSIYGQMKSFQPIVNSAFQIYQKTFRIEEILP
ncbi:MAG: hypothetical protein JWO78_214 [Micavibrio sp.]|nr:hypothetical protein [Micavibrio sp.]